MLNETSRTWWQQEIFYQIYPASFKDSNNDGIGDLLGITSELPKLKALGVTAIWLSPVYRSPMVDNGYDISDYQAIDPRFGTMADFDALMAAAKELGIKVVMDLVVNHTSDQHQWFQAALTDPTSPYRQYYIFRKGHDGQPPNNWRSNFGAGSAWTAVPGEADMYYLHVFSPQQPDLNWENPKLRQAIYQMINWWLAKGLAGFRVDAITFIKKDQDFAAITPDGNDGLGKVKRKAENRPGLARFLKELNAATFKPANAVTIGEASGVAYDELGDFIGPNGYFSMIFDFHYADIDVASGSEWFKQTQWTPKMLGDAIAKSQLAIQRVGWGANFLENHEPAYRNATGAKALALLYFCLRGCPFIYQGQELGMVNAVRSSIDQFNDLSAHDNYRRALAEGYSKADALACVNRRSRDNARTPYPWNDKANGGFSDHQPWLPVAQQAPGVNWQDEQTDPNSVWHFYQKLCQLRNDSPLRSDLIDGDFAPLTVADEHVIAYARGKHLRIYVNLSAAPATIDLPAGRIWLNNYPDAAPTLKPYQAILIEVN